MSHEPYRLVAIGASVGGLEAISLILSQLPASFPVPIAIVQHRALTNPELLGSLLRRQTRLVVRDAEDGDELRIGTVYLAPPGIHLVVGMNGHLALRDGVKVKHVRPSADVLFASSAEVFERAVIALVLTGGDGDGADGITIVKQHGGTVVSQDEASARAPSMPRTAIETGDVDYILPLTRIAPALEALAERGVASGRFG